MDGATRPKSRNLPQSVQKITAKNARNMCKCCAWPWNSQKVIINYDLSYGHVCEVLANFIHQVLSSSIIFRQTQVSSGCIVQKCFLYAYSFRFYNLTQWPVWRHGRVFTRVWISVDLLPGNRLGQAAHMHVPLSPSSIIWYCWPMTLFIWEGNRRPGEK